MYSLEKYEKNIGARETYKTFIYSTMLPMITEMHTNHPH